MAKVGIVMGSDSDMPIMAKHMADFGFFIKKTQPCKNFLINSRLSNK